MNDDTNDRITASLALLRLLGVTQVTHRPCAGANWYAHGFYKGRERSVFSSARHTVLEELCRLVVSGARCPNCGRPTILGATTLPGRCAWIRRDATYFTRCGLLASLSQELLTP